MKITYLKLKNFSSVYTGMKKKSIEIDFSKSKNRVIVLVGKTGSGKTSILSNLHPFPYPTNDNRSRQTMIMEETEGLKEIHFDDDGNEYRIKHIYKNHNGKTTVKSFIQRNGEELNPNGNVTSFKETVEEELHVSEDYMKLMRIGPNVQTLLKMPSRSRKEFMGVMLRDIDVYNTFYKNVSEKVRQLKALMKAVASRMERIGITDIELTISDMKTMEKTIGELRSLRERLTMRFGELTGEINSIDVSGLDEAKQSLFSVENEIEEIEDSFSKISSKLDEVNMTAPQYLSVLNKEITEFDMDILRRKNSIDMQNERINNLVEKINMLKSSSVETAFSNLLEDEYSKLKLKVENDASRFKNVKDYYDPNDLKQLLRLFMEIESISKTIQSFGSASVKRVVQDIQTGGSTTARVNKTIKELELEQDALKRKSAVKDVSTEGYYLFLDDHKCPYKDFYDEAVKGQEEDTSLPDKLNAIYHKIDMYHNEEALAKNFEYIGRMINLNKDIISKCPPGIVNYQDILESIRIGHPTFDEERLTMLIELYNLYDIHIKDKERLKEMEIQITTGKEAYMHNEKILSEVSTLEEDIRLLNERISSERIHIENSSEEKGKRELTVKMLNRYLESDLDGKNKERESLKDKIQMYLDNINRHGELLSERTQIKESIEETTSNISHVEKEIRRLDNEISEYKKLDEEQAELEKRYNDIYLIRKELSPNEGVQLVFIKIYLERTLKSINNLLDKVYHGDLRIKKFKIDESDFLIPYVKNGITIPDIGDCSQGEESYVGMALSFALMFQSISKYNIPGLDEIDGPLDTESREKFIDILEDQLDDINAEQCFLITHNDLFEDYPVDVISTSSGESVSMKNKNILFQA